MELYEFTMPDTVGVLTTAYYNSGVEAINLGGKDYSPIPIARGEISFEFDKNELTINMPMDMWPASEFKLVNPYGVVTVIVKDASEVVMFNGRIQACAFNIEKAMAKLSATSIQEVLNSQVPVKVYSPACPYELYGTGCGLNKLAYRLTVPFSSSSIAGLTVVNTLFASQPDGYYTGGWVETADERTTILDHTGDTLTVMFGLRVAVDDVVDFYVFPGCDKLINTCKNKYNNEIQFGGFPWIPPKNPINEEF